MEGGDEQPNKYLLRGGCRRQNGVKRRFILHALRDKDHEMRMGGGCFVAL